MKVALINPDMFPLWEEIQTDSLRKPEYRPPIGLMMIGACLRQRGLEVRLWDNYVDERKPSEVASEVLAWQPDVIGISVLTTSYPEGKQVAELIREEMPSSLIIMGGHHPTLMPQRTLEENPSINAIIVGEGELLFSGSNRSMGDGGALAGSCRRRDSRKRALAVYESRPDS